MDRALRTLFSGALALALFASSPPRGIADAPAPRQEEEDPFARLARLKKRAPLSAHTAGVAEQAQGVAVRLRAAKKAGDRADSARLERLLAALLTLAEATQARDDERALFETTARRLADVEGQLHTAQRSVADAGAPAP